MIYDNMREKVKDSSFVPQREKALMSTSIGSEACSHVICYFVTCQEHATLCYILPIRPRKIQG